MPITLNGTTGITTPADTITGNATVGGTLTVGGVAAVAVAPGTSGNVLTSNGTAWTSAAPTSGGSPSAIGQIPFSTNGSTYTATQKIVAGTAVASTSGTSIDFTSIPSWVKRITIMFNGVSTNGGAALQIQLFATSLVSSGYTGYTARSGGTNVYTAFSSAFVLSDAILSSDIFYGSQTITLLDSNTWVFTGMITSTRATGISSQMSGSVALGATLTGIRITTTNGTDAFDAGTINLLWE